MKSLINSPNSPFSGMVSLGRIATLAVAGTFFIILMRYADERYRLDRSIAEQEQLVLEEQAQRLRLLAFQDRGDSIEQALSQYSERCVTESTLSDVQNLLVRLAKDHNCQLKKASPRGDRLYEAERVRVAKQRSPDAVEATESPLPVEVREVGLTLSLEGTLEQSVSFLRALDQQHWLRSISQFQVRRDPSHPGLVAVDLEIKFQRLEKKKVASDALGPIAPPKA